ncbi:MAG: GNAT family N-acetyltransferase [Lachnospiraceae bacterium]|nr:GNAT family N-acetyltransferase [Lachnospiraceae bacterium]
MNQSVNLKEADIVISNYYRYYQAFARSGIVEYHDGPVSWIKPKDGASGPSLAFRIRLDEKQAEEQLRELIEGIQEKRVPELWHITPDAMPKNVISLLEENGFKNMAPADAEPEPTMLLYQKDFCPYVQKESNIVCRRVKTKEDFRAWIRVVNTALHGWDMIDAEHYYVWVQSEDIRIYLCEIDGVPVSTAATICNGDVASLEFASTLEEYRRRGAAISLCSKALTDLWENGVNMVTLGACEESPALYEKLGFHKVYHNVLMILQK